MTMMMGGIPPCWAKGTQGGVEAGRIVADITGRALESINTHTRGSRLRRFFMVTPWNTMRSGIFNQHDSIANSFGSQEKSEPTLLEQGKETPSPSSLKNFEG